MLGVSRVLEWKVLELMVSRLVGFQESEAVITKLHHSFQLHTERRPLSGLSESSYSVSVTIP